MRNLFSLAGIAALFCAFTVPAAAADAAKGKELYTKRCRACHGDDGSGSAAMKKKHGDKWKDLAGKEIQAMSNADLAKAISASPSHKAMAKTLKEDEVADIVAHVKSLKK